MCQQNPRDQQHVRNQRPVSPTGTYKLHIRLSANIYIKDKVLISKKKSFLDAEEFCTVDGIMNV